MRTYVRPTGPCRISFFRSSACVYRFWSAIIINVQSEVEVHDNIIRSFPDILTRINIDFAQRVRSTVRGGWRFAYPLISPSVGVFGMLQMFYACAHIYTRRI